MRRLIAVLLIVLLGNTVAIEAPAQGTYNPKTSGKDYYYDPGLKGEEINVVLYEGPGTEHMKPYIPAFQQATGIKVNIIEIAEANLVEKEVLDLQSKAGAYDIVQTTQDGAGVARFASAGWIEPLSPYLDKTPDTFAYQSDFAPAVRAATSWPYRGIPVPADAKPYALMQELTTRIFVYRRDLLSDPQEKAAFQKKYGYALAVPTTTKQLRDVAEFFTRPAKGLYGISFEGARDLQLYAVWVHFLWAFGGEEWNPATYQPTLDTAQAVNATAFYLTLSKFTPPGHGSASLSEAVEAFAQGKAAMSIIWGPTYGWAGEKPKSTVAGKVGFGEIPGAKRYLVAGVGMGISKFSKSQRKKEASWSFISFMLSPTIQRKMQLDGNAGPRLSVLKDRAIAAKRPAETLSGELAATKGHAWAMAGGVGQQFVDVVVTNLSKAVAGQTDAHGAMIGAQKEATGLFTDAGLLKK
jgi:multiple sugar transport system substrate-binding protein